jgi:arginyl-tRNA--protein-N-Asp/Glu arginylyltransferase
MRLELQIPDDLVEDLKRYKPRTMSLPMFCAYLVELGVDRDVTLAERPTGSVASNSSNISNTISSSSLNISSSDNNNTVVKLTKKSGKTGKSRKRPEYSEDFNNLWKLYQSAPDRVSSQTKPKAFDEWKAIVALEGPETLLEAARRAIEEQKRRKTAGEFVGSLPDLFRWLRDGKYEVYLEEHKTQASGRTWSADMGCWIEND